MARKTKQNPHWESTAHVAQASRHSRFGGKKNYPELISEAELRREQEKLIVSRTMLSPIALPELATLKAPSALPRKKRLRLLYEALSAWVVSALSWLHSLSRKRMLTKKGERALMQLRSLSDVYFATSAIDGMDIVAFQAAFGEAYYHILSESKRRSKSPAHLQAGEDYGAYLEQFARAAGALP